ncbi:MAG: hypothetical protein M9936_28575 [Caldilinea sp.]|nr:hypothetical protein [Caldilinea sp.]
MSRTVTTYVDVDVDINDFTIEELVEELRTRQKESSDETCDCGDATMSRTVTTYVDVDIDDFSTEELIEELRTRQKESSVADHVDLDERIAALHQMIVTNADARRIVDYAHELCRDYLGKEI